MSSVARETGFAGDADVAGGGGVAASGTLAERKAAHLSLRGCDREAAAIQLLGKPIEDPQTADIFRETIKVIFTEVREAVIKVMRHQQVAPVQGEA